MTNFQKVITPVLVGVAIVALSLGLIKSHFDPAKETTSSTSPKSLQVESTFSDFELTRLDGSAILFSRMVSNPSSTKVVLINFWATWCEACVEEMPSIVQLWNHYKDKGLQIASVNLDETPGQAVEKAAKKFSMEFPIYRDPEGKLADLFDVRAIPYTLIVESKRKILFVKHGEINWHSQAIQDRMDNWLK